MNWCKLIRLWITWYDMNTIWKRYRMSFWVPIKADDPSESRRSWGTKADHLLSQSGRSYKADDPILDLVLTKSRRSWSKRTIFFHWHYESRRLGPENSIISIIIWLFRGWNRKVGCLAIIKVIILFVYSKKNHFILLRWCVYHFITVTCISINNFPFSYYGMLIKNPRKIKFGNIYYLSLRENQNGRDSGTNRYSWYYGMD